MMLLFFGGQVLINGICTWVNEAYNNHLLASNPNQEWVSLLPDYIDISPFAAGVATIGFIFGAATTERPSAAPSWRWTRELRRPCLRHAGKPGLCADPFPQMMRHAPPGFWQQLAGAAETRPGLHHRAR